MAKHKPRSAASPSEEWIASRFPLPTYVTDRDPPYRPDAVVWLSRQGLLHTSLFHPEEPVDVVGKTLIEAMERPMVGPPRKPASVRVPDPALVAPIRAVLGQDVAIHVRPVPEMDRVREVLSQIPAEVGEQLDPWDYDKSIPAPLLAAFHSAAARLYRTGPWDTIPDDEHLLSLHVPSMGLEGACLAIIGQRGESFGCLLYRSFKDYMAFREMALAHQGGVPPSRSMGSDVFSVNFEKRKDVPPRARTAFMRHGWELASPDAYPVVIRLDADMVGRPASATDLTLALLVCEALARFVDRHEAALNDGFNGSLQETYRIEVEGVGEREISIAAPHPGATQDQRLHLEDWGQGGDDEVLLDNNDEDEDDEPDEEEDDEEEDEEEDDEEEDEDDKAAEAAIDGVVNGFLNVEEARGRDPSFLNGADYILDGLCHYKMDYVGTDLETWTGAEIESFMMEHIPRKMMAEPALLEKVPDILSEFAGWLVTQGSMERGEADALSKRLQQRRKEFLRRAQDPRTWGMAKSLFSEMQDSGVDIEDENDIQRYIAARNSHAALPFGPGIAATAPCPCGSGRRYKKCCMQR